MVNRILKEMYFFLLITFMQSPFIMWYWKKSCLRIASLFVKCSFLRLHWYRQWNCILGHFIGKMWWKNYWKHSLINTCGPKWQFNEMGSEFLHAILWKSLGGLIALDRTLESRMIYGVYNLIFVNGAYVNILQLVLLWGLNNVWVCGTGVVQRSCLWRAHSTWVACPSLPAQLRRTHSQLDCPNSVASNLFTLGQVI